MPLKPYLPHASKIPKGFMRHRLDLTGAIISPEGLALVQESATPLLWVYTLPDLCKLYNCSQAVLEGWIRQGKFHPADLESVCIQWTGRVQEPGYKREWKGVLEAMIEEGL